MTIEKGMKVATAVAELFSGCNYVPGTEIARLRKEDSAFNVSYTEIEKRIMANYSAHVNPTLSKQHNKGK